MFNEAQLDALKELCNIGSGSAATVLSSFLRRDLRIAVPRIIAGSDAAEVIQDEAARWIRISHAIGGPIGGRLVVCVNKKDAEGMLETLMGNVPENWEKDEDAMSAVREISNILTSYFLSVLGQFFQQVLVPGIPEVDNVDDDELIEALSKGGLAVETSFSEKGGQAVWYLLVLPEPEAMHTALSDLLRKE